MPSGGHRQGHRSGQYQNDARDFVPVGQIWEDRQAWSRQVPMRSEVNGEY
jgi:hypothetical protein